MKTALTLLAAALLAPAAAAADNELTAKEKADGWILLFDGKTLDGWMTSGGQPSRTPAEDGCINPHKCGDYMMVHKERWGDFVLSCDFKISKGCNSGVFVRTSPLKPRPGKDVGYNGIEVGRITDLQFDPSDPQRVIVTMQVQPNLNIREDSVASIDSQGFTGGAFVEITGGTAKSPLLVAREGQRYPVIRTRQSTFAQLQQSVPEVVAKLSVAASRLNDLLNDNNRRSISHILANLD